MFVLISIDSIRNRITGDIIELIFFGKYSFS